MRLVGVTYYLLALGVMEAHETLTLTVLVRTQEGQPINPIGEESFALNRVDGLRPSGRIDGD